MNLKKLGLRSGTSVLFAGTLILSYTPAANASTGPVLSTTGGSTAFVAGDNTTSTPVAVDPDVTVTDGNSQTLTQAVISITGNFQSTEDELSFTNNGATMGNILGSYNSATGVLTLTSAGSSATLAQWQSALESVTYTDSAVTPNTALRTISFSVSDGSSSSNPATKTVTVTDTDQTPIVKTTSGSTYYDPTAGTPIPIDSGITVSDRDNTSLSSATVSINNGFQAGDTLIPPGANVYGNIIGSYNTVTGVLTLTSSGATATLEQWKNALSAVTYASSGSPSAQMTVDFVVNDGTKSSAAATKEITTVLSSNADLSNLTLSVGTLNPAFSSATTSYSVDVPGGTTSIQVTPTVADATATLTVNGASCTSGTPVNVSLNNPTTIVIVVTAQNGSTKTYQITVSPDIPPVVNGAVQVSTADELEYIDSHQNDYQHSNIELMNDIDMSGLSWMPISHFDGTFNGNGFTLDHFSIGPSQEVDSDNEISLFGSTDLDAVIKNLTLNNVSVLGESYETVAVVVADNAGSVKNVGVLSGSVSSGGNENDGVLVANNSGSIDDSFSLVDISGGYNTFGDLVGANSGSGSILDSYATGIASGNSATLGGLVGSGSGTVTHSYYNSANATSQGGTPLSLTQLQEQSSFAGWDFANVWGISSAVNGGYPYLRLPAPTGMTHQNVTSTGWTESWEPVTAASSYDIYLNGQEIASHITANTYTFTGETASQNYQVTVAAVAENGGVGATSTADVVQTAPGQGPGQRSGGPTSPVITTVSFAKDAQVDVPYSQQMMTIGGTQPYQWSLASGALPPGLTLSDSGQISGTPTGQGGQYTFTVEVTDANHLSATQPFTLTVDASPNPSILTTVLPPGTVGRHYSQTLAATAGTSPYAWSVIGGSLPEGLRLDPPTGEIYGTPTESGIHAVTVKVTDHNGTTATQTVNMDILQPNEREILWAGRVLNTPAMVGYDGGTRTTYMPMWYVMQSLKSTGIHSTWDGREWRLTTSLKTNLLNIQAGTGITAIYLNGALIQRVNTKVAMDPWTNKPTTYVPIWYVEQFLNRVGLQSTWNGTTWTVK